jgi:hypothetical protein
MLTPEEKKYLHDYKKLLYEALDGDATIDELKNIAKPYLDKRKKLKKISMRCRIKKIWNDLLKEYYKFYDCNHIISIPNTSCKCKICGNRKICYLIHSSNGTTTCKRCGEGCIFRYACKYC